MPSRIVIVSGACGVGKSTTLRAMVEVLDDVAALETDHFYMMIDPTWSVPWPEAQRYWNIGMRMAHRTVAGFVERGTDLIAVASNGLQHSFLARAFARSMPDGVPVHHLTLDPGLPVIRQRMAARVTEHNYAEDQKKTPDWVDGQVTWFRKRYGSWTHVIDNSEMTPHETAYAIRDVVAAGGALFDEPTSYFEASEPVWTTDSAIELMLACGRAKTNALLIDATLLNDDFFDLSTGFAGELLQKFVNYGIRVAILLYPGGTYSPAFERFLIEARHGREMRVFAAHDDAVAWLSTGT